MSFLACLIGDLIPQLLLWLVVLTLLWLLATPVILIAAVFVPIPYWSAVKGMFGSVTYICNRWMF